MYKSIILILHLCLLVSCVISEAKPKPDADYSTIGDWKIETIDSIVIDNLTVLGKVWGFVKYHHPVFSDSIYNIDYELFELLPQVTHATKSKRNRILAKWIDSFGKFKYSPEKYDSLLAQSEHLTTTDCAWINDRQMLGTRLSRKLQHLRYADRTQNIYISTTDTSEKAEEYSYLKIDSPNYLSYRVKDVKYRLLSLFKYWNIIEYYYPYRNLTDANWSELLSEYIPQFTDDSDKPFTYNKATARLIAEINDSHGYNNLGFIFGKNKILPSLDVVFVEDKLIVKSNDKSDIALLPGDEILSINGITPKETILLVEEYIASSNYNTTRRAAAIYALFTDSLNTNISFRRDSIIYQTIVPVDNEIVGIKNQKSEFRMLSDSVGYILPCAYDENMDPYSLKRKIDSTKILIIDHRCIPILTSYMLYNNFFITEKPVHISNFACPIITLPGYFKIEPEYRSNKKIFNDIYKGKIILLVNAQTQSRAEYITMILQTTNNAIVVGSQTAGADGNISRINLPGNINTFISSLGVYYSDGTPTQRIGVKIDHYVEPTIKGIKEGRDEVLEKALEIIEKFQL